MSKRKTLTPAFPSNTWQDDEGTVFHGSDGMTLRDWFASQAMNGWLASMVDVESPMIGRLASFSYQVADAMLAARKGGA